jgi:hypothetical protein
MTVPAVMIFFTAFMVAVHAAVFKLPLMISMGEYYWTEFCPKDYPFRTWFLDDSFSAMFAGKQ